MLECAAIADIALEDIAYIGDSDVDVLTARNAARDISKQIENQMEYPGQIKVSIVRESRAVDYAK